MTDRKSPTGALALLDRNRLSDVRFIAIASSVFYLIREFIAEYQREFNRLRHGEQAISIKV